MTNQTVVGERPDDTRSEDFLFFYMPDALHGEFCQWYPSIFEVSRAVIQDLVGNGLATEVAGSVDSTSGVPTMIKFNCAKQFMMLCKAARFSDYDRQRRIMATDSPKEQKRLAKLTVNFTEARWDEVKSQVVEAGNLAKFNQNIHLQRKLLATGDRILCEAASRDRVWGIGYTAKHAMSQRKHWGENRLGKALMAVRTRLREAEEEQRRVERPWEYEVSRVTGT